MDASPWICLLTRVRRRWLVAAGGQELLDSFVPRQREWIGRAEFESRRWRYIMFLISSGREVKKPMMEEVMLDGWREMMAEDGLKCLFVGHKRLSSQCLEISLIQMG